MIEISRRAALKFAAALQVAAGAPVVASSATTETAPAVAALKAQSHPWRWWVGHDEEVYHTDFDTREEAVAYAQQCDYAYIAECQQQDFSLDIDADEILDGLANAQYDLIGEGEFIETTTEQRKDLGERLTRVMYEWAYENNISLTAWSFGAVRNRALVDAPCDAEKGST